MTQPEQAEAALLESLTLARGDPAAGYEFGARDMLANFYARHQRLDKALEQLEAALALPLEDYELSLARRSAAALHILNGNGTAARGLLEQAATAGEEEYFESLTLEEYSFYIPGSPQRRAMESALSYWAEGDADAARRELARGAAEFGNEFESVLADYARELRSWGDEEADSIHIELNDMVVAMAVDLELIAAQ